MNKDDQKEYGHRLIALRAELEELETMSAEACSQWHLTNRWSAGYLE